MITALAFVLENNSYDLLIGTQFFENMKPSLFIMKDIPPCLNIRSPCCLKTHPKIELKKSEQALWNILKEFFNLSYCTHTNYSLCFPEVVPVEDGVPLLAPTDLFHPSWGTGLGAHKVFSCPSKELNVNVLPQFRLIPTGTLSDAWICRL